MREIRVQKPGNDLPFISGDATSGDVTSGDVTILTNHPQILNILLTCALKGRSILDNAHSHSNAVDYCNQKKH